MILALISMSACSGFGGTTPTPNTEQAQAPLVQETVPPAPEVEPTQQPAVQTVIVTQVVTITERIPVTFEPTANWWDKVGECSPRQGSNSKYLDDLCRMESMAEEIEINDFYRLEVDAEGNLYEGQTIMVIEAPITSPESSMYARVLGSRHTAVLEECPESYSCEVDKETIRHAIARLDQGHGGVVIDAQGPKAKVIANLRGLDQAGIEAFWAMYIDAHHQGGNEYPKLLEVPAEVVGVIYPQWAADIIANDPTLSNLPASNTCGPANVDELPWNNPTAAKDIQPVTVTNTFDSILVFRPWWDPANRFPLYSGDDPSSANKQGQIVLYPNQSVTGDWNGGPIIVYLASCTIEQVLADARRSGPSWPFMYIDPNTNKWVELPADQNTWPLAP